MKKKSVSHSIRAKHNSGFTLIELIVVIAMLGTLVLISAPKFIGYTKEARIKQNQSDAKVISGALDYYTMNHEVLTDYGEEIVVEDLASIVAEGQVVGISGQLTSIDINKKYYEITSEHIDKKLDVKKNTKYDVFASEEGEIFISLSKKPVSKLADFYYDVIGDEITNFHPAGKPEYAHLNLPTLTSIRIPTKISGSKISKIGRNAFLNKGLVKVHIPGHIKRVGNNAFKENEIVSIVLEKGIQEIGNEAFRDNNLTSVSIPSGVNIENSSAIFADNQLTTVSLPNDMAVIPNRAFEDNKINTLKLPDSLKIIGRSAFYENALTGELILPSTLEEIHDNAFTSSISDNDGIQNQISGTLTIPNSVKMIGLDVFSHNRISEIVFPEDSSLTILGFDSFTRNGQNSDSSILEYVTVSELFGKTYKVNQSGNWEPISKIPPVPPTTDISSYYTINGTEIEKFHPNGIDGSKDKLDPVVIPSQIGGITISSIGESAFRDLSIAGSIVIPAEIVSIGYSAFSGNQLSRLGFEENSKLTTIEDYAFDSNLLSGEILLPDTLMKIGDKAFRNNKLTGEISIPSALLTIGVESFRNNNLDKISFKANSSLEDINSYAFDGNNLTGTLAIPDSVTLIDYAAFRDNELTTLQINESSNLSIIGAQAFRSNGLTGELLLPEQLLSIGKNAFDSSSSSITKNKLSGEITIPSSLINIGDDAFKGNAITSIKFPLTSNLTTIGLDVFKYNGMNSNSSNLNYSSISELLGKRYQEVNSNWIEQ